MTLNRVKLTLALSLGVTLSVVSGVAQAAVQPYEVFLSVYDSANTNSYVYDTGLNASTDMGNASFTATLDSDPRWQAFLTVVGANAQLNWSVGAFSMQNGVNTKAWWTTTAQSQVPLAGQSNGALGTMINNLALGFGLSSIDVQHGVVSEGAGFGAPNYYGAYTVGAGSALVNSNLVGVGGAQTVFRVASSDTSHPTALATVSDAQEFATFSNTSGHYVFSLMAAPVPEPGTWALAMAGLVALAWRNSRKAS